MPPRTMKTNPAFLTEQELVDSFVVRHTDLELVMQIVRENTGDSNQHVLVVGTRGIGKTTLVLRAVAEIKRSPELNRLWYPIVFAEESYQVATPGEFWLEALFHLARQTDSPEWRAAHADLMQERDEERLRERALAQLMDFADSQKKRILLVVENLNMLLGEQLSHGDAWTLRHALMNEPRLMMLASATQQFDEVANSGKALFEQFRTYELRPLDTRECAIVWTALTQQEVSEFRIRPIEILTGGNPRLVRILALFGSRKSLQQLMTDLTHLVDEHTEYFKSYLDGLAASERKVFVSLAEIWEPATAREVAAAARLDVSKTSAFLKRLVDRGAVSVFSEQSGKKTYQVAERMYNIYYLMRRRGGPSSRIRAAVNFIVGMYAPDELAPIAEELIREAFGSGAERRDEYYHALDMLMRRLPDDETRRRILLSAPREFLQSEGAQRLVQIWAKQASAPMVREGSGVRERLQRLLRSMGIASTQSLGSTDSSRYESQPDDSLYNVLLRMATTILPEHKREDARTVRAVVLCLIYKILAALGDTEVAMLFADTSISENPENAELFNVLAWELYESGDSHHLSRSKSWVNKAVSIDADNMAYKHTLACILCALGKPSEAEEYAVAYLADTDLVRSDPDNATELVAAFAAADHGREVLELVQKSPSADYLEPLIVGLQLILGESAKAPVEIVEVAKDVVKRIEQRRERMAPMDAAKMKEKDAVVGENASD